MRNNLESIIKDLYELDPTLRSEDQAVRGLVASLLLNKPVVLLDQAFARDLRAKLLVAHSTESVVVKPIASQWFMYLAPVGVVAVLVFMMVPKPLSHQAVPTELNEAIEQDSSVDVQIEGADEAMDAKRSFITPEATPTTELRTMEAIIPTATVPAEMEIRMPFFISDQQPGQLIKVDFVSFNEPTFLVIQKDRQGNPGEVIGVSQVLMGRIEGTEIALMQKMLIDKTFFATAYRDNGDGIYTPGKDTPVYDASGTLPLKQLFSTRPF